MQKTIIFIVFTLLLLSNACCRNITELVQRALLIDEQIGLNTIAPGKDVEIPPRRSIKLERHFKLCDRMIKNEKFCQELEKMYQEDGDPFKENVAIVLNSLYHLYGPKEFNRQKNRINKFLEYFNNNQTINYQKFENELHPDVKKIMKGVNDMAQMVKSFKKFNKVDVEKFDTKNQLDLPPDAKLRAVMNLAKKENIILPADIKPDDITVTRNEKNIRIAIKRPNVEAQDEKVENEDVGMQEDDKNTKQNLTTLDDFVPPDLLLPEDLGPKPHLYFFKNNPKNTNRNVQKGKELNLKSNLKMTSLRKIIEQEKMSLPDDIKSTDVKKDKEIIPDEESLKYLANNQQISINQCLPPKNIILILREPNKIRIKKPDDSPPDTTEFIISDPDKTVMGVKILVSKENVDKPETYLQPEKTSDLTPQFTESLESVANKSNFKPPQCIFPEDFTFLLKQRNSLNFTFAKRHKRDVTDTTEIFITDPNNNLQGLKFSHKHLPKIELIHPMNESVLVESPEVVKDLVSLINHHNNLPQGKLPLSDKQKIKALQTILDKQNVTLSTKINPKDITVLVTDTNDVKIFLRKGLKIFKSNRNPNTIESLKSIINDTKLPECIKPEDISFISKVTDELKISVRKEDKKEMIIKDPKNVFVCMKITYDNVTFMMKSMLDNNIVFSVSSSYMKDIMGNTFAKAMPSDNEEVELTPLQKIEALKIIAQRENMTLPANIKPEDITFYTKNNALKVIINRPTDGQKQTSLKVLAQEQQLKIACVKPEDILFSLKSSGLKVVKNEGNKEISIMDPDNNLEATNIILNNLISYKNKEAIEKNYETLQSQLELHNMTITNCVKASDVSFVLTSPNSLKVETTMNETSKQIIFDDQNKTIEAIKVVVNEVYIKYSLTHPNVVQDSFKAADIKILANDNSELVIDSDKKMKVLELIAEKETLELPKNIKPEDVTFTAENALIMRLDIKMPDGPVDESKTDDAVGNAVETLESIMKRENIELPACINLDFLSFVVEKENKLDMDVECIADNKKVINFKDPLDKINGIMFFVNNVPKIELVYPNKDVYTIEEKSVVDTVMMMIDKTKTKENGELDVDSETTLEILQLIIKKMNVRIDTTNSDQVEFSMAQPNALRIIFKSQNEIVKQKSLEELIGVGVFPTCMNPEEIIFVVIERDALKAEKSDQDIIIQDPKKILHGVKLLSDKKTVKSKFIFKGISNMKTDENGNIIIEPELNTQELMKALRELNTTLETDENGVLNIDPQKKLEAIRFAAGKKNVTIPFDLNPEYIIFQYLGNRTLRITINLPESMEIFDLPDQNKNNATDNSKNGTDQTENSSDVDNIEETLKYITEKQNVTLPKCLTPNNLIFEAFDPDSLEINVTKVKKNPQKMEYFVTNITHKIKAIIIKNKEEEPDKKDDKEPVNKEDKKSAEASKEEPDKKDKEEPDKKDETEPDKKDQEEPDKKDQEETDKKDKEETDKKDKEEPVKNDENVLPEEDKKEPVKGGETLQSLADKQNVTLPKCLEADYIKFISNDNNDLKHQIIEPNSTNGKKELEISNVQGMKVTTSDNTPQLNLTMKRKRFKNMIKTSKADFNFDEDGFIILEPGKMIETIKHLANNENFTLPPGIDPDQVKIKMSDDDNIEIIIFMPIRKDADKKEDTKEDTKEDKKEDKKETKTPNEKTLKEIAEQNNQTLQKCIKPKDVKISSPGELKLQIRHPENDSSKQEIVILDPSKNMTIKVVVEKDDMNVEIIDPENNTIPVVDPSVLEELVKKLQNFIPNESGDFNVDPDIKQDIIKCILEKVNISIKDINAEDVTFSFIKPNTIRIIIKGYNLPEESLKELAVKQNITLPKCMKPTDLMFLTEPNSLKVQKPDQNTPYIQIKDPDKKLSATKVLIHIPSMELSFTKVLEVLKELKITLELDGDGVIKINSDKKMEALKKICDEEHVQLPEDVIPDEVVFIVKDIDKVHVLIEGAGNDTNSEKGTDNQKVVDEETRRNEEEELESLTHLVENDKIDLPKCIKPENIIFVVKVPDKLSITLEKSEKEKNTKEIVVKDPNEVLDSVKILMNNERLSKIEIVTQENSTLTIENQDVIQAVVDKLKNGLPDQIGEFNVDSEVKIETLKTAVEKGGLEVNTNITSDMLTFTIIQEDVLRIIIAGNPEKNNPQEKKPQENKPDDINEDDLQDILDKNKITSPKCISPENVLFGLKTPKSLKLVVKEETPGKTEILIQDPDRNLQVIKITKPSVDNKPGFVELDPEEVLNALNELNVTIEQDENGVLRMDPVKKMEAVKIVCRKENVTLPKGITADDISFSIIDTNKLRVMIRIPDTNPSDAENLTKNADKIESNTEEYDKVKPVQENTDDETPGGTESDKIESNKQGFESLKSLTDEKNVKLPKCIDLKKIIFLIKDPNKLKVESNESPQGAKEISITDPDQELNSMKVLVDKESASNEAKPTSKPEEPQSKKPEKENTQGVENKPSDEIPDISVQNITFTIKEADTIKNELESDPIRRLEQIRVIAESNNITLPPDVEPNDLTVAMTESNEMIVTIKRHKNNIGKSEKRNKLKRPGSNNVNFGKKIFNKLQARESPPEKSSDDIKKFKIDPTKKMEALSYIAKRENIEIPKGISPDDIQFTMTKENKLRVVINKPETLRNVVTSQNLQVPDCIKTENLQFVVSKINALKINKSDIPENQLEVLIKDAEKLLETLNILDVSNKKAQTTILTVENLNTVQDVFKELKIDTQLNQTGNISVSPDKVLKALQLIASKENLKLPLEIQPQNITFTIAEPNILKITIKSPKKPNKMESIDRKRPTLKMLARRIDLLLPACVNPDDIIILKELSEAGPEKPNITSNGDDISITYLNKTIKALKLFIDKKNLPVIEVINWDNVTFRVGKSKDVKNLADSLGFESFPQTKGELNLDEKNKYQALQIVKKNLKLSNVKLEDAKFVMHTPNVLRVIIKKHDTKYKITKNNEMDQNDKELKLSPKDKMKALYIIGLRENVTFPSGLKPEDLTFVTGENNKLKIIINIKDENQVTTTESFDSFSETTTVTIPEENVDSGEDDLILAEDIVLPDNLIEDLVNSVNDKFTMKQPKMKELILDTEQKRYILNILKEKNKFRMPANVKIENLGFLFKTPNLLTIINKKSDKEEETSLELNEVGPRYLDYNSLFDLINSKDISIERRMIEPENVKDQELVSNVLINDNKTLSLPEELKQLERIELDYVMLKSNQDGNKSILKRPYKKDVLIDEGTETTIKKQSKRELKENLSLHKKNIERKSLVDEEMQEEKPGNENLLNNENDENNLLELVDEKNQLEIENNKNNHSENENDKNNYLEGENKVLEDGVLENERAFNGLSNSWITDNLNLKIKSGNDTSEEDVFSQHNNEGLNSPKVSISLSNLAIFGTTPSYDYSNSIENLENFEFQSNNLFQKSEMFDNTDSDYKIEALKLIAEKINFTFPDNLKPEDIKIRITGPSEVKIDIVNPNIQAIYESNKKGVVEDEVGDTKMGKTNGFVYNSEEQPLIDNVSSDEENPYGEDEDGPPYDDDRKENNAKDIDEESSVDLDNKFEIIKYLADTLNLPLFNYITTDDVKLQDDGGVKKYLINIPNELVDADDTYFNEGDEIIDGDDEDMDSDRDLRALLHSNITVEIESDNFIKNSSLRLGPLKKLKAIKHIARKMNLKIPKGIRSKDVKINVASGNELRVLIRKPIPKSKLFKNSIKVGRKMEALKQFANETNVLISKNIKSKDIQFSKRDLEVFRFKIKLPDETTDESILNLGPEKKLRFLKMVSKTQNISIPLDVEPNQLTFLRSDPNSLKIIVKKKRKPPVSVDFDKKLEALKMIAEMENFTLPNNINPDDIKFMMNNNNSVRIEIKNTEKPDKLTRNIEKPRIVLPEEIIKDDVKITFEKPNRLGVEILNSEPDVIEENTTLPPITEAPKDMELPKLEIPQNKKMEALKLIAQKQNISIPDDVTPDDVIFTMKKPNVMSVEIRKQVKYKKMVHMTSEQKMNTIKMLAAQGSLKIPENLNPDDVNFIIKQPNMVRIEIKKTYDKKPHITTKSKENILKKLFMKTQLGNIDSEEENNQQNSKRSEETLGAEPNLEESFEDESKYPVINLPPDKKMETIKLLSKNQDLYIPEGINPNDVDIVMKKPNLLRIRIKKTYDNSIEKPMQNLVMNSKEKQEFIKSLGILPDINITKFILDSVETTRSLEIETSNKRLNIPLAKRLTFLRIIAERQKLNIPKYVDPNDVSFILKAPNVIRIEIKKPKNMTKILEIFSKKIDRMKKISDILDLNLPDDIKPQDLNFYIKNNDVLSIAFKSSKRVSYFKKPKAKQVTNGPKQELLHRKKKISAIKELLKMLDLKLPKKIKTSDLSFRLSNNEMVVKVKNPELLDQINKTVESINLIRVSNLQSHLTTTPKSNSFETINNYVPDEPENPLSPWEQAHILDRNGTSEWLKMKNDWQSQAKKLDLKTIKHQNAKNHHYKYKKSKKNKHRIGYLLKNSKPLNILTKSQRTEILANTLGLSRKIKKLHYPNRKKSKKSTQENSRKIELLVKNSQNQIILNPDLKIQPIKIKTAIKSKKRLIKSANKLNLVAFKKVRPQDISVKIKRPDKMEIKIKNLNIMKRVIKVIQPYKYKMKTDHKLSHSNIFEKAGRAERENMENEDTYETTNLVEKPVSDTNIANDYNHTSVNNLNGIIKNVALTHTDKIRTGEIVFDKTEEVQSRREQLSTNKNTSDKNETNENETANSDKKFAVFNRALNRTEYLTIKQIITTINIHKTDSLPIQNKTNQINNIINMTTPNVSKIANNTEKSNRKVKRLNQTIEDIDNSRNGKFNTTKKNKYF